MSKQRKKPKVTAFADELTAVISRHYRKGVTCKQVGAFLAFQAYAALEQIEHRTKHEQLAMKEIGRGMERILEPVPGWVELVPPTCACGETMTREGNLWQCGAEHCRNFIPVH